jgi:hypothetical protein
LKESFAKAKEKASLHEGENKSLASKMEELVGNISAAVAER